jgi:hypothetical protein
VAITAALVAPLHAEDPREFLETLSPMGSLSTVDDVASAVVYLTEARQITGELDVECGRDALRTASMSPLAAARAHLGSLDRVTRVVRLGIYLATSRDFFDQPRVADAASELFEGIFGKDKTSVRMVLGVASLPLGMHVELEVILEVAE